MNEKRYKELMQTYFLNEISDDEKVELENYLLENDNVKSEFEKIKKMQRSFSENRPAPLSDRVLEESRQTLLRTIRLSEENESGIYRLLNSIKNIFAINYKIAFSGIGALTIGLFLGYLFFSPSQPNLPIILEERSNFNLDNFKTGGEGISDIRFQNQANENGEIEFSFNTIKPVRYKGSINDEMTLKLLAMALIKSENPGVRLKSLNTIASQTAENIAPDPKVKSSMITALKTDENAGVRKEALNVLMKYPFDNEVRDAFLFVLQNDRNSGMRVSAINALTDLKQKGKSIDDEIKNVLNEQAESADNNFIRLRAASLLQEVN